MSEPRAMDVVDYILREKGRMTPLRLVMLLYYCNAWWLATGHGRMFPEPVRATPDGPMVETVPPLPAGRETVSAADIHCRVSGIPNAYLPVIDAVLASYGGLSDRELRDLACREDPWRNACNGSDGEHAPVISDDSMLDYYSRLRNADMRTRLEHHVPHFAVEPIIHLSEEDFDWLTAQL